MPGLRPVFKKKSLLIKKQSSKTLILSSLASVILNLLGSMQNSLRTQVFVLLIFYVSFLKHYGSMILSILLAQPLVYQDYKCVPPH